MHSRPHERLLHKRRGIFDRVIQYLPVTHKPHVPRYESLMSGEKGAMWTDAWPLPDPKTPIALTSITATHV